MPDTIPGNTSSTQSLTVNTSGTGTIDYYGDTDWWRVSLNFGYGYQIWLEGSQSGKGSLGDPYVAVYTFLGTPFSGNNNYDLYTSDAYYYFTPYFTGTYFLSAEEFGNDATGSYTITVRKDQLASIATGATVQVNRSVTDQVGWQNDYADWYWSDAHRGRPVRVRPHRIRK